LLLLARHGGREEKFPGEERILIASPKVATYDLKPEMSAYEVTEALLAEIAAEKFDGIILNFANPDMVGHSGMLEPTIKAIEVVDECLGKVVDALLAKGGAAHLIHLCLGNEICHHRVILPLRIHLLMHLMVRLRGQMRLIL